MKISKQKAQAVATKLVADKFPEIEETYKEMSELVTKAYKALIPKEVLALDKTHPKYLSHAWDVRVYGEGISVYHHQKLTNTLPRMGGVSEITLTPKNAGHFMKLHTKYFDLVNKKNKLEQEIYHAILALSTYKRCETDFPEAYELLPKEGKTQLTVNLSGIRSQLRPSSVAVTENHLNGPTA